MINVPEHSALHAGNKMSSWLSPLIVLLVAPLIACQGDLGGMPPEVVHCVYERLNITANDGYAFIDERHQRTAHVHCIKSMLWHNEKLNWKEMNVTDTDMAFMDGLIGSMVHGKRTRRSMGPRIFSRVGPSYRREIRRLSDKERMEFNGKFRKFVKSGYFLMFAKIHKGLTVLTAHSGPSFLGWHRVYLALFEELFRKLYGKHLAIPYWDSTLDYEMVNPINSIVWTKKFFGNGDGFVTSGPCAYFKSPDPLVRNIGCNSRLMSKQDISAIMSNCHLHQISNPTAKPSCNIEKFHGGPHLWVGGCMAGLNTAAADITFYLHHAFIDYIWEMFRKKQRKVCGVNPNKDYPAMKGMYAAGNKMKGLPEFYRNFDGLQDFWSIKWARYEQAPTCSKKFPSCGSPYLYCNQFTGKCVSAARIITATDKYGKMAKGRPTDFPAFVAEEAARGKHHVSKVYIGKTFDAPPYEKRPVGTGGARMVKNSYGNMNSYKNF